MYGKLVSATVLALAGASALAQSPVFTNIPASGAPSISGDLIAYPAGKLVSFPGGGVGVVHTLRYYSIASGVSIDTGKELALFEQPDTPVSPAISGARIAYIARTEISYQGRLRVFDATTGQDVDTGQDVYLVGSSWSPRLAAISGDLVVWVTPSQRLAYYNVATATATTTEIEAHGKPSVSGNLIAYLNGNGCTIRYFNVATGVDTSVGQFNICDEAPAISGNVIAFTTGLTNPNTIVYHDITTGTTTDTGTNGFSRSVSGNVIAFMGENLLRYHRIAQRSSVETGLPLYVGGPDVSQGVIAWAPFADDGWVDGNDKRLAYLRVEQTDTTIPTINIVSPTPTTYTLGQSVAANFSCSDSGSGVATCLGSVPSGQYIDTATEGTKVFAVNASDAAGNAATRSVTYAVAKKPPAGTPAADLGLTMTHDAGRMGVTTGTRVNYNLVVRNAGPSVASAVQIRLDVPTGMSIDGASVGYNLSAGGTTGTQMVFDLASLSAGASASVLASLRVQAAAGTTITTTASTLSAATDLKTKDNTASTVFRVR